MIRRFASLLLAVLLPVSGHASAFSQLKTAAAAGSFSSLYDGSAIRAKAPRAARLKSLNRRSLAEAKALLSHGTTAPDGGPILPFTFRHAGGADTAQSAGLEGFLYAERSITRKYGGEAVDHHLKDYFDYLDALLAPVAWAADARADIRAIEASTSNPREKYEKLMSFVEDYTEGLRAQVAASDASDWIRGARIYEIFPRAYNLEGKRAARDNWDSSSKGTFFSDFKERDIRDIKKKGFDTLWVMGVFPIGKRDAFGTGGGSPYSVSDHAGVHPDLGTVEEMRAFVGRAHAAGMRVIMDFIPNHTSMDSKLLNENPDFFIHRKAGPGEPPHGYFDHTDPGTGDKLWVRHGGYDSYGSLAFWEDTAQVDMSNPSFRRRMIDIVSGWVERTGVDGFRVDMAYQVTNSYFSHNWGKPMPEREFLEELTTEVKSRYPGTAFIAEAYDKWDTLSQSGMDLIYGKNNIGRPGGHTGWYDAIHSRDAGWIREAIKRAAFLDWQKGGAEMMSFVGNHDEASPQRAFGPWMKGASFLTLMMPGSLLFYGSQEIGFDKPNLEREPKSLPFSVPVKVDWESADPDITRFYNETFRLAAWAHEEMIQPKMESLDPIGDQRWAGYLLVSPAPGASLRAAAVVANPSDRTVSVRFKRPDLGIDYSGSLPPFGYALIPL